MTDQIKTKVPPLLNGTPYEVDSKSNRSERKGILWKKRFVLGVLMIEAFFAVPRLAHGQFVSLFEAIFSSIQNDIGSSLEAITQIAQQTQQLYRATVAPLTKINQARGFVANSVITYRGQMDQVFDTPFSSAVTAGTQRFENILHSRTSAEIPALQAAFAQTFGAIPVANAASPQDRLMMDIDDALGQESLKTTMVADQGADVILQTASAMEHQVAMSTPGSNPFLTAEAQVANLRCQAFIQKMLVAELRHEAGRIAHDNVLVKRRTAAAGGIDNLITGSLTAR